MFVNLNIENPDLLYISKRLAGDDINLFLSYDSFTFGFHRLNPISILDIVKIWGNADVLDSCEGIILHSIDFHSLSIGLFCVVTDRRFTYANHDAKAHEGYGRVRRILINALTRFFIKYAEDLVFFSENNFILASRSYQEIICNKRTRLMQLPSPADEFMNLKVTRTNRIILFGRNEDYKIDENYLPALKRFMEENNMTLITVGEIGLSSKLTRYKVPYSDLGYLSDEELAFYVASSQYNVMIYKSITQSGVLEFARKLNTPSLISEDLISKLSVIPSDYILHNDI